jgi:hypothetical protein
MRVQSIHYLPATHASKEGNPGGCGTQETGRRVSMSANEVTCKKCLYYYWHVEGIQLSASGIAALASFATAKA